jgi:hypothetical protein
MADFLSYILTDVIGDNRFSEVLISLYLLMFIDTKRHYTSLFQS